MLLVEKVGAVVVVGGGVAGLQASLDLADSGYLVYLVERSGALGGTMARLGRTFPGNSCSMCFLSPRMVRCGRHANIRIMTLTEVERIEGESGDFTVTLRTRPRYVSMEKCVACGECARRCPVSVKDEHQCGDAFRRAIYIPYAQAVPAKYRIDPAHCRRLAGGECRECMDACPNGAVIFDDVEKVECVRAGSIILAPGLRTFDPSSIRALGYGVLPNVITSMELERRLSVTGPTGGRLVRPSDGKAVRKAAFLQCVGSRDRNKARHGYCSSICCTSALREALDAQERAGELEVSFFFTDLRTQGRGCESYSMLAMERGARFHRCRVHSLEPTAVAGDICLRYVSDEGRQVTEEFDLVVLSVGLEASLESLKLVKIAGIATDIDGFAVTSSFAPLSANRPGIYVCGAFSRPSDITLSLAGAAAAAAEASIPLADVRYSLSAREEPPPLSEPSGSDARIGVFFCRCGLDLSGIREIDRLAGYAASQPSVAATGESLFACSQDAQECIRRRIVSEGLNRVVIAGCRFPAAEPVFRGTLRDAGLDVRLFGTINPDGEEEWHPAMWGETAGARTASEIRNSVRRARSTVATPFARVGINPQALIIGGGIAGMVAALGFADQGFPVHLVEKTPELGGNARNLYKTWKNESIPAFVNDLVTRVKEHPLTTVHLRSVVTGAEGMVGNYRSSIRKQNSTMFVEHGVVVLAPGGAGYKPDEYGYGRSRRVVTALEFDRLYASGDERFRYSHNFVFIQCVGSREPERPYCSRVCCTHALQSAVALKEEKKERSVFVLYRDMRSYGQREELYRKAREAGVVFMRYGVHEKPGVAVQEDELDVVVRDHVLHEPFSISADLVILAPAIVPSPDIPELARLYGAALDGDGFLVERPAKVHPVDVDSQGVFFAGLAVHPKSIEETIEEARAAVARATTILCRRQIVLNSAAAQPVGEERGG